MTLRSKQQLRDAACERIVVARRSQLVGVELTTVSHAKRLWRVFHEKYALVCPVFGVSARTFRGRSISRQPGELMLYAPGDFDTNTYFEPGSAFHVVSIEASVLEKSQPDVGRHDWRSSASEITSRALCIAVQDFAVAMHESDSVVEIEGAYARLIGELMSQHLRAIPECRFQLGKRDSQVITQTCNRLQANLDGALTLDELARAANLNNHRLLRLFKAYTGTTPSAYRQALRVARARTLLRRDRRPSDVSKILGFADFSHFRRTFVKYAGLSPNEYRRALSRDASIADLI